jgi:excisionase family DNA binding protein
MKLIDIKELSGEIGESERTLRNWVHDKKIPFLKIGHRTMRFELDAVRKALSKFEVKQAA